MRTVTTTSTPSNNEKHVEGNEEEKQLIDCVVTMVSYENMELTSSKWRPLAVETTTTFKFHEDSLEVGLLYSIFVDSKLAKFYDRLFANNGGTF